MNWSSTAQVDPDSQAVLTQSSAGLRETTTLDQILAERELPLAEALRLSMALANALREMHDQGRVHGALTPACIEIGGSGLVIAPGRLSPELVSPYAAPEVLRGQPADTRSDIFSFGDIVFEMMTGRRAFEGTTPEALAAAIVSQPAAPVGNPALEGLISHCLAKDPAARWQRIQKAQMELRLLAVSARRVEAPPRRVDFGALLRAEVHAVESRITDRFESHERAVIERQQAEIQAVESRTADRFESRERAVTERQQAEIQAVESRLAARFEAQERALAELQQAVTASLQSMQAHLCTVDAKIATAQESLTRAEEAAADMHLRISGCEQRLLDSPKERIGRLDLLLQSATERISRLEQAGETARRQAVEAADTSSVRLHAIEQAIGTHADALEAARRAIAQSDDLVERVVEALDSLQSIVFEKSEERSSTVN